MELCLELAGIPLRLHHRYAYIAKLCRDYRTEKPPKLSLAVTDAQIEAEAAQSGFSKPLCEATCLHRAITQALVPYGILLIHSAVVALDGEAYVFLAKSGVGKSTHIRLWKQVFGDRCLVVNGDKPYFSFQNGQLMVHGSPWQGKENWGIHGSFPVKAFCLLQRGLANTIEKATQAQVVDRFFHQVLLPEATGDMLSFMTLVDRVITQVPFYSLHCNMQQEAALVACQGMRKETL